MDSLDNNLSSPPSYAKAKEGGELKERGHMAALRVKRIGIGKAGFSMVEVLIALALLGIVGFGFLAVLANSSAHTLTSDIRNIAESIARTEMEYIKSLPYEGSINPPVYAPQTYPGWNVIVTTVRLDPINDGLTNDDGMQKITIRVQTNRGGTWNDVVSLEGYKYFG
jgi:prepilin-type N-terminal cleavage/methylation domain-containing protein